MTPDWLLQLTWFVAGVFATGAFWYFLAQHSYKGTLWTGLAAAALALLAVAGHIRNDIIRRRQPGKDEITIEADGEVVRFTEMLRSVQHDVVKIHAHTHTLGVAAEYEWLRRRYPKSKRLSQGLTTLDLITGKGRAKYSANQIHFDILEIQLADGRKKEIYFDISSFFGGGALSHLDPEATISRKIAELYKAKA